MQTITVSLAEAMEHLPDLIAHIAKGYSIVITDGGRSVARLIRPQMPPTSPDENAEVETVRRELIRKVVESHDRNGSPLPQDHPLRAIIAQENEG